MWLTGNDPVTAFRIGAELAAMTHGHPSGYLSSGFLAASIAYINNGKPLIDAIEEVNKILKTYNQHEETIFSVNKALDLFAKNKPTYKQLELLGSGLVGEGALSISLYCSFRS